MNTVFPKIDCFIPWTDDDQACETIAQLSADEHVAAIHYLKEEGGTGSTRTIRHIIIYKI